MPKENSLLQEIGHLKKQVQALERQNSSSVLCLRKGSEGVEVHGQCRCFSLVSASSSNNPSSSWEREEIRWLREEQRWIHEEQRWVREETRWSAERESLLQEIDHLKKQVQALERQKSSSVSENVSSVDNILKVLKEVDLSTVNKNLISESGSGPIPMMLESEKEEVKEMRAFR
ncbi:hypothetical protein IFM89_010370 [Coptis chinensis]|uniref:Uncharacterized protein n=1 Tax=Coptis chinensis TaxID=261450 RepID=A0A835HT21_9MAGN|nr:hypothetical protein IFM89_010370 [Coptis chinensis]